MANQVRLVSLVLELPWFLLSLNVEVRLVLTKIAFVQGDAMWGFLRAITLLLKTLFVALFEVVDGVVTRRSRGGVEDERLLQTQGK